MAGLLETAGAAVTPYVNDADFQLYVGDVRDCLRELPAESVHTVVTSPPYWGLRDYGTGAWDGGDPDCDHLREVVTRGTAEDRKGWQGNFRATAQPLPMAYSEVCGKCGATRVDQQLGLEPTPEAFVAAMVDVFREVRRVLRADGTLWLNLGSSYASGDTRPSPSPQPERAPAYGNGGSSSDDAPASAHMPWLNYTSRLKQKDMVPIPWMVAMALQQDGWYLRADIVWSKANPMPESVTDRPTKAHEYVFLLSKSPRYFFDQEAVREPHKPSSIARGEYGHASAFKGQFNGSPTDERHQGGKQYEKLADAMNPAGRNVRSVWEIATQPYSEAHFATFPEALPERCIRAGCPAYVCATCYAPVSGQPDVRDPVSPCCGAPLVPGTTLDPFMGSGTTALVARRLGRRSIGVELNPEYAALCARRLQQLSLEFA